MEGGNTWLFVLEFLGFTVLTLALAAHQLWALKKLELKRRDKERATEQDAPQAG